MSKEYIGREEAILAVRHAWAKGLEPTQYIEQIPAADVTPVVHGWWQSYESSRYVGVDGKGNPKYRNIRIYYCSQCGHCSIIRTKGCPNCRAKMDKEEANERMD